MILEDKKNVARLICQGQKIIDIELSDNFKHVDKEDLVQFALSIFSYKLAQKFLIDH